MSYSPGLHLLLDIKTKTVEKLTEANHWKDFMAKQVSKYNLQMVGEAVHSFEKGGFTAIHGLTESHASIHTWPEYGYCTCDIFLSNFSRDNTNTVVEIGKLIIDFFESTDYEWREIKR